MEFLCHFLSLLWANVLFDKPAAQLALPTKVWGAGLDWNLRISTHRDTWLDSTVFDIICWFHQQAHELRLIVQWASLLEPRRDHRETGTLWLTPAAQTATDFSTIVVRKLEARPFHNYSCQWNFSVTPQIILLSSGEVATAKFNQTCM